jgi:hypothetical protein
MNFQEEVSQNYVHLDEVGETLKCNAYYFLRRRGVLPLPGTKLYRRSEVLDALERGTLERATKKKARVR